MRPRAKKEMEVKGIRIKWPGWVDPGGPFIYPEGAGITDLGIVRGTGARECAFRVIEYDCIPDPEKLVIIWRTAVQLQTLQITGSGPIGYQGISKEKKEAFLQMRPTSLFSADGETGTGYRCFLAYGSRLVLRWRARQQRGGKGGGEWRS
ncbi:hypothetical protein E2C01_087062 [Portunus trituberculatus]|uniref:Uncharacterized protein n=1 Tax=Portunus trituberculatus TaxID=210409 RepID=A0A5B7JBE1_PORTR|nr:hypothetical protein [Portunus trituberculatus]